MKYYAVKAGNTKEIIAGEWSEVELQIRERITGVSNPKYKGFKTEAEAQKYLDEDEEAESAGEALEEDKPFEFTTDAVVFVDGSCNFDNNDFDGKEPNRKINKREDYYYSSYGMIIFYRDGSIYVESAKLVDNKATDKETSYTSYRNGFTITKDKQLEKHEPSSETLVAPIAFQEKEFNNACLRTSWNASSELEAARRAVDICYNEKKLKTLQIFYDCKTVSSVGNAFKAVTENLRRPELNTNITNFVGTFLEKLNDGERHIDFQWIPSHAKGPMWAKFNDCVDILAKSETYKRPIGGAKHLNPNLKEEGVRKFKNELEYSEAVTEHDVEYITDARRKEAYNFIYKVLSNEAIRPKFI